MRHLLWLAMAAFVLTAGAASAGALDSVSDAFWKPSGPVDTAEVPDPTTMGDDLPVVVYFLLVPGQPEVPTISPVHGELPEVLDVNLRHLAKQVACRYSLGDLNQVACPLLDSMNAGLSPVMDVWDQTIPPFSLVEHMGEANAAPGARPTAAPGTGLEAPGARATFPADLQDPLPVTSAPLGPSADPVGVLQPWQAAGAPLHTQAGATMAGMTPHADVRAWLAAGLAGTMGLLGFALYHRIARHAALEQETRRSIYEAIRAHPGLRVGTLSAQLNLSYKTVGRHVAMLHRAGLVEGVGQGQQRWFVPGTAPNAQAKRAVVAASAPASQAVLAYLKANGTSEVPDLCAATGLPRSSAGSAIGRMEAAGLVERRRVGRRCVVALRDPPASAQPDEAQVPMRGAGAVQA